jgi:hypothetical protein
MHHFRSAQFWRDTECLLSYWTTHSGVLTNKLSQTSDLIKQIYQDLIRHLHWGSQEAISPFIINTASVMETDQLWQRDFSIPSSHHKTRKKTVTVSCGHKRFKCNSHINHVKIVASTRVIWAYRWRDTGRGQRHCSEVKGWYGVVELISERLMDEFWMGSKVSSWEAWKGTDRPQENVYLVSPSIICETFLHLSPHHFSWILLFHIWLNSNKVADMLCIIFTYF